MKDLSDKLFRPSLFDTETCIICGKSSPWPFTECMDCYEFDQWVQENAAEALSHQMENDCKDILDKKETRS